jgi:hypothetical protein
VTTAHTEVAERNSVEIEKWAQQHVHKAVDAKAVAFEHDEATQREKDMAVEHAAEAEQYKALFEE